MGVSVDAPRVGWGVRRLTFLGRGWVGMVVGVEATFSS